MVLSTINVLLFKEQKFVNGAVCPLFFEGQKFLERILFHFVPFVILYIPRISVHIFDVRRLASLNTISAHTNPLAALRFSYDGTKLATASTRGTVIRVFDTETGERLFEFTRGVKRYETTNRSFRHHCCYCYNLACTFILKGMKQRTDLLGIQNKLMVTFKHVRVPPTRFGYP